MALSVEKNWLMDCRILRLVNQCRRLIQSEFGVKPPLYEENLREMLAFYAGRSRQQGLQVYYAELRLALIELEGPDIEETDVAAQPAASKRMYRGQPLAAPVRDSAEPGAAERQRTLIYRGRVVRG